MCQGAVPSQMSYQNVTQPAPAPAADPYDFSNKYNTKLSPDDEAKYQKWAKDNGKEKDVYDYDMRGFWKDGNQFAENGHGADTYKKPNHPTFSDQSKYHGVNGAFGGTWTEKDGEVSFTPSVTNLRNMPSAELQKYFDKYEPGVKLNLPKGK